jgi:hypothetical protein
MSWTDLFKSKATTLKPDPRVRWFGKLPTYADYYTSKADVEWVEEFNDWILKGYEIYHGRSRDGTPRSRRMPDSCCVLRLPKSGMTVFAAFQDYGGDNRGRPIPLCLYVGVPTPHWPGPTHENLAAAWHILLALTELRDEVSRFLLRPGRFETVFESREIDVEGIDEKPPDTSWTTPAATLDLGDWFAAVRDTLEIPVMNDWFRRAAAWGEMVAEHASGEFEPTLRFPMATAFPIEVQTAGWLRWLGSRMDLTRHDLSLVVTGGKQDSAGKQNVPGTLTVIAREPTPEDFLLATPAAGGLAYLDDLSRISNPDAKDDQSPDPTDPEPDIAGSWKAFVEDRLELPD